MKPSHFPIFLLIFVWINLPVYGQIRITIRDSSVYFYTKGQYDQALRLAQRAEQLAVQELGEQDTAYVGYVDQVGLAYMAKSDYKEADSWLQKSLRLRQHAPDSDSLPYAVSLTNLGTLWKWRGDNLQARRLHEQALRIRERAVGHEHALVAECLFNLAVTYFNRADYVRSLQLYVEALRIQAKTIGMHHASYAQTLNNLGSQYGATGEFAKAIPYYEAAQRVRAEALGMEHPDYLIGQNNLAVMYFNQGNFARSYALNQDALRKIGKALGKKHLFYFMTLNGIAMQRLLLGQREEALREFTEVVALSDSALGPQSWWHGIMVNNLANTYQQQGNYNEAEPLFEKACRIWLTTIGRKPQYAMGLNNLAMNCQQAGDTTGVLAMLKQTAQIMVESQAELNPLYGLTLSNQGLCLLKLGQPTAARRVLEQSLGATEKSVGRFHPTYSMALSNLAAVFARQHKYRRADSVCHYALNLRSQHLLANAAGFTELERAKLNSAVLGLGQYLLSLHHDAPAVANHRLAYEWVMQSKGQSLDQLQRLWRSIEQSTDTSLANQLADFRAVRQQLVFQYQKPLAQQQNVAVLENRAADLERSLTQRSPALQQLRDDQQIDFRQVKAALKPGEAAIEFIHFQYRNQQKTDSVFYVAYVVRPEWNEPKRVFLAEERQLQAVLTPGYARDPTRWLALSHQVWQPLQKHLVGVSMVYIAPSGLLHRVAFAALPYGSKQVLADRFVIHQLNSTREVVNQPTVFTFSPKLTATLLGGVEYENDSLSARSVLASSSSSVVSNMLQTIGLVPKNERTVSGRKLPYLPYTLQEVTQIKIQLAPMHVQLLTGLQAREDSLKALSGHSPHWLHIATHGFWFADAHRPTDELSSGQSAYRWSDNPLLRSGLLLAGSEGAWRGIPVSDAQDDGILTAYEVAGLNLSQTQVAVMSACQTGLGDVRSNEGVYGLQRALKLAGVRYVVASLWPIADAPSAAFMTRFYSEWRKGPGVGQAFRNAQAALRRQYTNPYYWAGFVLVE